MFILSQDKKKFADYRKVYVSQKYKGKKSTKVFIFGVSTSWADAFDTDMVLGCYENEETAIKELENICTAMRNGESAYAVN